MAKRNVAGFPHRYIVLFEQENSIYYVNTVTKESSWDRPAGFVTAATENESSQVRRQADKLSNSPFVRWANWGNRFGVGASAACSLPGNAMAWRPFRPQFRLNSHFF